MKSFEISRIELYAITEDAAKSLKAAIDCTLKHLRPVVYSWGYEQPTQETLKIGFESIQQKLERFLSLATEHQNWHDEELLK